MAKRRTHGSGSAVARLMSVVAICGALLPLTGLSATAFPGAVGHGRDAKGGQGGRIIAVTTLADAGPGSLRACIEATGPRVCIFRVSGVIRYTTMRPDISNPFITIAGETAPGDGILITHMGGKGAFTPFVIKNTHDVIVRHIRVRMDRPGEQRQANSAFIIESSRNIILDHVSASWARDENIGGYAGNDNITISHSIFAEGVPKHDKCALLASDPTGPQKLSFIGNICAHNGDRNPDINFPPGSCVEVINNILYNASLQFSEVWESNGGTPVNIVNNYYKRGPNTVKVGLALDRPRVETKGQARIYFSGNKFDGGGLIIADIARPAIVARPVCPLTIKPLPADSAYDDALREAGAFPRDSTDQRIVEEVRSRTGKIGQTNHTLPILAPGRPYDDSDGDGMSDSWEKAQGLDPKVANPWDDGDRNGWSNLEEFLDYAHRERMAGRAVR